jgi:heme-degrading monooxygenase HmoA
MLCAHTIRRLKPGTYDEFKAAFTPEPGEFPEGWVRFHTLRSLADENEVITFGFFDGTLEELEQGQQDSDYYERRAAIDQYVEEVVTNGIYEVAETLTPEGARA